MNILKLNSVDEIKEYSSLNGYFEVDGKFYTTCPNCGNPIALDRHVTRVDLLRDANTLERISFCDAICCYKWQEKESNAVTGGCFFPYFTRDAEAGNFIDFFASLEDAQKAIEKYEEEDKSNGDFEPDFYEIYNQDTEEIEE